MPPARARDGHRGRAAPISRQSAKAISRWFSRGYSRNGRIRMAADARGRPGTLHPGARQIRPGRPMPASGRELRRGPDGPARAARGSGDHLGYCRQYAGHNRGYRVTIVRICPIGGFRDARANTAHIETGPIRNTPYGDRNRRGGSMVVLCQATGADSAARIPGTRQVTDLVNFRCPAANPASTADPGPPCAPARRGPRLRGGPAVGSA